MVIFIFIFIFLRPNLSPLLKRRTTVYSKEAVPSQRSCRWQWQNWGSRRWWHGTHTHLWAAGGSKALKLLEAGDILQGSLAFVEMPGRDQGSGREEWLETDFTIYSFLSWTYTHVAKGPIPRGVSMLWMPTLPFSLSSAKCCWVPLLLIPRSLSYTLICLMPKIHSEMLNFNNLLACCQSYYSVQVS